jgi:cytochrome P450
MLELLVQLLSAAVSGPLLLLVLPLGALLAVHALTRKRVVEPGPPEWPLVQALPWLLRHRPALLEALVERSRAYGGATWTVKWPLSPRFFFITSPAAVEHVLRTRFDNYEKGPWFTEKLEVLLGAGIFNSDGPRWERARKLASHMFSQREFEETIMAALRSALSELEVIAAAAAAGGGAVDVHALFHRFTLDTIGQIAFGADVGALRDAASPFAAAFDAVQALAEARFFSPGWQLTERLDGTRARINAAVSVLDEYCAALVTARRAAGDASTRRDLLSRFMLAQAAASGEPGTPAPGSPAADRELRDVVLNFMIAGRDTTAQALSWAVHSLATRAPPAVEAALVAEARTVLGGTAPLSFAAATKGLVYATAVMRETLRLYPSVPKDAKTAVADDVLPDGTRVSAGDIVAYLPYVMGRLESNWDDPEAFAPARFLGERAPSSFLFIAFNAGRRTCLGQQLALVEAASVLALLYRRWELRLEPGQRVTYAESLTLPMKHGLYVRFIERT